MEHLPLHRSLRSGYGDDAFVPAGLSSDSSDNDCCGDAPSEPSESDTSSDSGFDDLQAYLRTPEWRRGAREAVVSNWDACPTAYTNDSFLDRADPLFAQIQRTFLTKQQEVWGNITHLYTLDQSNENDPLSDDTAYLASVAAGTLASLRVADPAGVWVMQGWLFFPEEAF
ncbi:hypothetical protein PsYK624_147090 [Phanerochaete sordida]|uniref:Alpha-N-acetylglucosaminidase tim-barrel domain-containing protein n=1 Tax=Phanerochaete sordida TaxID=48140 RepID=A0A9P3GN32_9APHY|nr:hypothetical protein PsYK624_147090 [Phanerochaete sordida]